MKEYTVTEYAELTGVVPSRIRQMLIAGELNGRKRSSIWFVYYDRKAAQYLSRREEKKQVA